MAEAQPVLNIADALKAMAVAQPDRIAIRLCGARRARSGNEKKLDYRDFDALSDEAALGLQAYGVAPGMRVALMVRPGEALFVLMFALFKMRAVPVLIDPGIGKRALKACLAQAAPEAFIGIPLAHLARIILGWARASVKLCVTVGPKLGWSGPRYEQVLSRGRQILKTKTSAGDAFGKTDPESLAAILFTSGSTGIPKGVAYKHRHFVAQIDLIKNAFGIRPGEIDLPTFPPFALFDPGLGMTSVIPDMDPTRPVKADPEKLIGAINRHACTSMFGSPALLKNLAEYAVKRGIRLDGIRRVLSAGAPVRPEVIAKAYAMLPEDAEIWTPYGATECLPVSIIEGREVLSKARHLTDAGAGICVGRPLSQNTVRIIAIDDGAILAWSDELQIPHGQIGEIVVAGPTVTESYFRNERATALAKIRETLPDGASRIVHRMGDVGYFDAEGLLWYCGRKSHRVETIQGMLFSEMVEGIFNTHAEVEKSALVGIGNLGAQVPAICIERKEGSKKRWPQLREELRDLAERHAMTRDIEYFFDYGALPVDIRHNAKINREKLARWAAKKIP